mgnify:CR=1 FL=1
MKKETPFFSVIIPNYNHAPYLHERIDSVLNQTFKDWMIKVRMTVAVFYAPMRITLTFRILC